MANQNIFGSITGWRGLQTRVNHAARTAVATAMLALVAACGGSGVSAPAIVGGDLSITPNAFTWTGAFKDGCVSGGLTSHLITGGTPPYAVGQSIPAAAILTGSPPGPPGQVVPAETVTTVGRNFGSLLVMVTGAVCSTGAAGNLITVTDSIGRVATLTMGNTLGTADPPAPGAAMTLPVPTLMPSTFTGLGCGVSTSFFVVQNIPAGYTGTPPVLSVVPLEPQRITANLSNGITTVTRSNTDPGGGQTTLVRVSNGVNFADFTIGMAGVAPFACAVGSATPITDTTGIPLSLKVGVAPVPACTTCTPATSATSGTPGTTVSRAFDGGTGPYTITSAAAGIAVVSNDGATFAATITVALGAPKVFFARTPVGTLAGAGSFITVSDSSVPQQTLIIVVTTIP